MRKPNYFNSEGYPDPTSYFAELHMMQEEQKRKEELYSFRPIVYINGSRALARKGARLMLIQTRKSRKQSFLLAKRSFALSASGSEAINFPIVYICSPYAGDIKTNVKNARRYSRFAVKKGYLPITPHLLFPQFLDDTNLDEREIGIHMELVLISKCVEVWVFGERISEGMQREIKRARWRGIKLRFFSSELQEEIK